jgi:hypothetical protein
MKRVGSEVSKGARERKEGGEDVALRTKGARVCVGGEGGCVRARQGGR